MFRIIYLLTLLGVSTLIAAPSITYQDARQHIDKEVVLSGKVTNVSTIPSGMIFVNFGTRNQPDNFTAIARPNTLDTVRLKTFQGKTVEITGTITLYKDNPQIILKADADIRLKDSEPTPIKEENKAEEPTSQPEQAPEKTSPTTEPEIKLFDVLLTRGEIRSIGKLQAGTPPETANVAIAFPANIAPETSLPILTVFPDFYSDKDLEKLIKPYARIANSKGWAVIAARSNSLDFSLPPTWHTVMFQAAFRQLESQYPGISRWPVTIAGNNDGASRATLSITPMLDAGFNLQGCYLSSLKRENLTNSNQTFSPSKSKLKKLKTFVSYGQRDGMVSQQESLKQAELLKQAGLKLLKHETHDGPAGVDFKSLEKALDWFQGEETD